MKKLFIAIISTIFIVSCNDDFLDQVPDDRLTFEDTFKTEVNAQRYLANVYSQIPSEYAQRYTTSDNSGPWTGASDEAEYVWGFHMGNYLNVADWNATTQEVSNLWSNFYRGIRSASTFIANIENCADCTQEDIKQYTSEARILRAFYYYNLMRSWGPVLLLGDTPIPPDADLEELGLQRNSIDEVTQYITSEMDIAIQDLENVSFEETSEAGRVGVPFAMFVKQKTLLFAASPLFNGNTQYSDFVNSEGENLIPQTYNEQKWKAAADVSKAFIEMFVPNKFRLYTEQNSDGSLNPYLSVRNVMITDFNEEIIYARPRGGDAYTYDITPYHLGADGCNRGGGGLSATQAAVDAFFTSNGRSIDDPQANYTEDGFSEFQAPFDFTTRTTYNPWTNREPRFYNSITYNGALWLNRGGGDIFTKTWYGGNSGRRAGTNDYPPTGYVVRKSYPVGECYPSRALPMFRLAELYLDYVEALNEYDPGNADILKYLNLIRERAGIPLYGSPALEAPSSQAEMREAIHKERRVELFVESVRYFDVRRWLIADEVLDGPAYGMDINAREEADFYNIVEFENRVFRPQDYLWPIPQDEINANPSLNQNPGW
ncbi:RagB/SusD family nutrient uptake outer membrane protein [Antarcticibacterium sp. 1MA-6-2]|uniref:RagB/SusD family nutrient uptake outer membrane protein n=1 Tax=Antarcticibacterium sp. 1MA-6-2 TaxID=2908210 RepID=UPI001F1B0469|nr:RagB/SusD family nutrient uptake outer membrane protein [Antarcticibacterium sp. 1MA-6-2]UJH90667.1 RagB/SusD family nutrient uptake outer membrane protein [Antarcticibacterium sp. 1MA-6-2]